MFTVMCHVLLYTSSLCLLPCLCAGPDEFHLCLVSFPSQVYLVFVLPSQFDSLS